MRRPSLPRAFMDATIKDTAVHFAIGAVVLAVMATAGLSLAPLAPLGGAFVPASLATYAVLLGILIVAAEHPAPSFGPANRITLVRALFVCLVGGVIVYPPLSHSTMSAADQSLIAWATVALAALAEGLDAVDGWVARRRGVASAFGARFDMETDSLFVLLLAILVWRFDKAGAWIIAAGALRYIFAVAGWLLPQLRAALPPSTRRQAVCVVMVLALIVCLAPPVSSAVSTVIAATALALLMWSFAIDIRHLWRAPQPPHPDTRGSA